MQKMILANCSNRLIWQSLHGLKIKVENQKAAMFSTLIGSVDVWFLAYIFFFLFWLGHNLSKDKLFQNTNLKNLYRLCFLNHIHSHNLQIHWYWLLSPFMAVKPISFGRILYHYHYMARIYLLLFLEQVIRFDHSRVTIIQVAFHSWSNPICQQGEQSLERHNFQY